MSRKNYLKFILIFPVLLIALFFILHIGRLFSGGPFSGGFFGRNENRKFEDYAKDLFRQEVSNNAITLHYTLKSPSDYGISKTPLSLGQVSTDTVAMGAAAENALHRLHSYDYNSLSDDNKLIYRLLEHTFSSAVEMAPYTLYEEPLSPLTGTQAQLPVLLSEYQFYSAADVSVYLDLLKELPKYFQAIADFERAKADAGLFMSYEHALAVMDECDAFVAMGDEHYLYATFEKRVEGLRDAAASGAVEALVTRDGATAASGATRALATGDGASATSGTLGALAGDGATAASSVVEALAGDGASVTSGVVEALASDGASEALAGDGASAISGTLGALAAGDGASTASGATEALVTGDGASAASGATGALAGDGASVTSGATEALAGDGATGALVTGDGEAANGLGIDWREWIDENDTCIRQYVFPAYELLKREIWEICRDVYGDGVTSGDSKASEDDSCLGLCHFPKGKDYYRLLVREMTGSDRSIVELKGLTLEQIMQDLGEMEDVLADIQSGDASGDGLDTSQTDTVFADSNPMSLLNTLRKKLDGIFPEPPKVDISVKYVDASMEEYLSPAFYLIPAIDNSTDNVIYINPCHMRDDLTLFTTLAHEGFPGHLYQTTYFASQNPHPMRSLLGCGGYTEGWATYCEMMSYYFAPVPKADATLMQKNSSVMLGLYALADMGIHYDGWTLMDTVDFFAEYGITDADAIAEIYDLIIGDPANYLKYYVGYLEFLELKRDAISCWGDEFSQERFHREVLEAGPVPFWVLREELGIE